ENKYQLNIDAFDFGPRAGLIFNLSDNFNIEATYYHGMNNILTNTLPDSWKWNVQQMTVGVRYKIFNREKRSSE
ncbi:MAG: hypothetical protein ABIO46_04725, partial [Chitinophagales bacterium]